MDALKLDRNDEQFSKPHRAALESHSVPPVSPTRDLRRNTSSDKPAILNGWLGPDRPPQLLAVMTRITPTCCCSRPWSMDESSYGWTGWVLPASSAPIRRNHLHAELVSTPIPQSSLPSISSLQPVSGRLPVDGPRHSPGVEQELFTLRC